MTQGTYWLRSALLVLLAFAAISGVSFAGGDLFDDDYRDCPAKTRLRDGEVADLTLTRDAEDEDKVNVSWTSTNPATWGLGSNAYRAALVAILDDGTISSQDFALNTKKTTFEGVRTGTQVTIEMALVVDTADGSFVISDILRTSINQSLTKPSFSTGWNQVDSNSDGDANKGGFQFDATPIAAGAMYYIGYNENFGNYKSESGDSDLITTPSTARLRIGLAHASGETPGQRDDVDFDAYIIRIADEDGDVISEGVDVATIASSYGTTAWDHDGDNGATTDALAVPNKLFLYDFDEDVNHGGTWAFSDSGTITRTPTGGNGTIDTGYVLTNVRINDGGTITVAMQDAPAAVIPRDASDNLNPDYLSMIKVGISEASGTEAAVTESEVFAEPPGEHRDLPPDVLASDGTYTIMAWAVNNDNEVISPVATLKVRPRDVHRGDIDDFEDYQHPRDTQVAIDDLVTTEFMILK